MNESSNECMMDPIVLLVAVHNYLESEMYKPHPDAPGHCHDVRGRWDKDGSVCEWCALWDQVREFVKQNTKPSGGLPSAPAIGATARKDKR